MGGILCCFGKNRSRQHEEAQAEMRQNKRHVLQQPSLIYNDARHAPIVPQGRNITIQEHTLRSFLLKRSINFHAQFLIFSKLY